MSWIRQVQTPSSYAHWLPLTPAFNQTVQKMKSDGNDVAFTMMGGICILTTCECWRLSIHNIWHYTISFGFQLELCKSVLDDVFSWQVDIYYLLLVHGVLLHAHCYPGWDASLHVRWTTWYLSFSYSTILRDCLCGCNTEIVASLQRSVNHPGSVCFTGGLWCLQYSQLGRLSVGPISYAEGEDGQLLPLVICKEYYRRGSVEPSDEAYDIDAQLEEGERKR